MSINLNELLKDMLKDAKCLNEGCQSGAYLRPMNLNPRMLLVKCEKCGSMGPIDSFKVHLRNANLIDPEKFLEERAKALLNGDAIIFCGAGISLNSGLPSALSLIEKILKKLPIFKNSEQERKQLQDSNLPFEAFINVLRKNSEVHKIYELFKTGQPNINHVLFAKLAQMGLIKIICTTNFDCLFERVFEDELGWERGKDFEVFYKEEDFIKINWHNNKVKLVKMHGSVEDIARMGITINHVASGALLTEREHVLDYLFSSGTHLEVLILGYSCSDIFDITPIIESINENYKKVFVIDHIKSLNEHNIEHIQQKEFSNPFHNFHEGVRLYYNKRRI